MTDDGEGHAIDILLARAVGSDVEKHKDDRYAHASEDELAILRVDHDDQELHLESEEEEEVEFEQRDVDLVDEIAPLDLQVRGDLLVDCPGEFLVQFPRNEQKQSRAEGDDAGNRDKERVNMGPETDIVLADVVGIDEGGNRAVDLLDLDRSVDEDGAIVSADANDLNGVLFVQRIVH